MEIHTSTTTKRRFVVVAIACAVSLIAVLFSAWSSAPGRAATQQDGIEAAKKLAADTAVRQHFSDASRFANGLATNNMYDIRFHGQRILVLGAHDRADRAQKVIEAHATARGGSALANAGLAVIQLPLRVRPQISFVAIVCPILQSIRGAFASSPFASFILPVLDALLNTFGCNPPPPPTTIASSTTTGSPSTTTTSSTMPPTTTTSTSIAPTTSTTFP